VPVAPIAVPVASTAISQRQKAEPQPTIAATAHDPIDGRQLATSTKVASGAPASAAVAPPTTPAPKVAKATTQAASAASRIATAVERTVVASQVRKSEVPASPESRGELNSAGPAAAARARRSALVSRRADGSHSDAQSNRVASGIAILDASESEGLDSLIEVLANSHVRSLRAR
jgi:hypothetical protein